MSIASTRRALFLAQRTLGDYQAVRRGRVGKRIANRAMGRTVSRFMRGLWR